MIARDRFRRQSGWHSRQRLLFTQQQTWLWRAQCPFRATTGLMHCSKQHLYSITSSARASSVGGNSRPSALAVLRLDQSRIYDATASAQLAFPRSTKDRRWNTKRLPIAARLRPRTSRFDPSPRPAVTAPSLRRSGSGAFQEISTKKCNRQEWAPLNPR
jgi:hypothetical protein